MSVRSAALELGCVPVIDLLRFINSAVENDCKYAGERRSTGRPAAWQDRKRYTMGERIGATAREYAEHRARRWQ